MHLAATPVLPLAPTPADDVRRTRAHWLLMKKQADEAARAYDEADIDFDALCNDASADVGAQHKVEEAKEALESAEADLDFALADEQLAKDEYSQAREFELVANAGPAGVPIYDPAP